MRSAKHYLRWAFDRFFPFLRVADRTGLAEPAFGIYFDQAQQHDLPVPEGLAALRSLDETIRDWEEPDENYEGSILIPFVHSDTWMPNTLFAAYAHAFRVRGYRPVFLVCNRSLPMCFKKASLPDDEATCALCHQETRQWIEALDVEAVYLSDLHQDRSDSYHSTSMDEQDMLGVEYRGVNISSYALASTRKFYRKHRVDLGDSEEEAIYRRFLDGAALFVDAVHELASRYDLKAVVGIDAGYIYHGTILETADHLDIPTVTMFPSRNHRSGTMMFGSFAYPFRRPPGSDPDLIKRRIETPLSPSQRQSIAEFMEGRKEGTVIPDQFHWAEDAHETMNTDPEATTVGLFSNLLWDGSLVGSHVVFDSPFSWALHTIEIVSGMSDVELVCKPHPAEAHRETNDKMADWIRRNVGRIPDNVTVLDPDTDVSPYLLMESLDAGIVYNSTLGLEMAFDGIPTITVGNAHYRGHGLTFDPSSIDEYRSLVKRIDELEMSAEMKDRADRYAHYFFLEKMVDIEFLDGVSTLDDVSLTHDKLKPGNENLDFVIERMINGEPILSPDSELLAGQ